MKKYLLLFVAFAWMSKGVNAQALTLPPSGDNQKASVTQYIGSIAKVAQIERELQSSPGFDPDNYAAAANYLLAENYKLDKALVWADKATNPPTGQKTFTSVSTKANVLLKMGKKEEAMTSFHEAASMADATPSNVHQ